MTASNHALTGAFIGLSVSNPVLALCLAFGSHFVLDSLPHFGDEHNTLHMTLNGRLFQTILFSDIALCFLIAATFFVLQPSHWFIVVLCAFIATSPDFAWFPDYLAALKKKRKPEHGPFRKFAGWIQWSQTPFGIIPELLWAGLICSLLYFKLR